MSGAPDRVVRDGMVAVLYSPGYGAGWSTWNDGRGVFDPETVAWVEAGKPDDKVPNWSERLADGDYWCALGANQLRIKWVPVGCKFRIDDYDGAESVVLSEEESWHTT